MQKVGAVEPATEFSRRRAGDARTEGLRAVLALTPDRPADPGDELPPGHNFAADTAHSAARGRCSGFGSTVPIRLTQTPTTCRVRPVAGIKFGVGRRLGTARDAEQRAEGVERVEAPIEAERELVEVGLQVFGADAVMDAVEPGLQIAEDEVDDRQKLLGDLGVAAFGDGVVVIAALRRVP